MGGDQRLPWLILLTRQFLIKLIMFVKGGSKREKRRWGGEGDGGLALEKEGERQGRSGTRARGFLGGRRGTSGRLGGITPVPVCLCSPQKGAGVKTLPSELTPLLGCWQRPPWPVSCQNPWLPRREAGPSFHSPPLTKPPSDPISCGSTRTILNLHG